MSDRLAEAIQDLAEAHPGLGDIVRVDIDDSGTLTLTAQGSEETRWFKHDDRGLIEQFPAHDKKLPLADHLRACNDWRVLSYRPGRRMVVLKRQGENVSVLKGHKQARSARAAVHQGVAEGAMRRGAFRVPRLLRHDGRHEALVFEFMEGSEVELGAENAPHYGRLGELLAVFQQDECAGDLEYFGARDEFEVLERWRHKVLLAVETLPEGWLEVRERLERCASALPAPHLGLCHRDLHDRQVHAEAGRIALLDFDLLCRADVALDPGNLVAHLSWRSVQGLFGADETSVHELRRVFLEGLGRAREPGFAERLAFYTASAFLRLALVYRLRPKWSPRISELILGANAVLDGHVLTP